MPLTRITVLDLTRLLPGAHCTQLLADMGADVIKVEEPGRGDYMRWYPPLHDGQSVLFNALNRNKRSLTLNLKTEAGRELFKRLAATVDVVVEGNRPGVMDRLGVGWDVLHALNPRLVVCAITGYGQDGPLADRAGHDINYMAVAGALSMNGERGRAPHPLAVQVADLGGGAQNAAIAILGALLGVAYGGEGRFLDVSMTDGALGWLAAPLAQAGAEGVLAPGMHRLTGRYACYAVYPCQDGHMSVGALEPKFWDALCGALGRPELVPVQYDEEEQDRIRKELEAVFRTATRDEWERRLAGVDACCEPVRTLDEVAAHPQVAARRLVLDLPTGVEVAPPVRMAEGLAWRRRGAPGLGEHTEEILSGLGLDEGRIATLRGEGVV